MDVIELDKAEPKSEDAEVDCVVGFEGFDHSDEDGGATEGTAVEAVESTSMPAGVLSVVGAEVGSMGEGVCGVVAVNPRFKATRIQSKSSFARLRMTGGTEWNICKSAAISFGGLSASWNTKWFARTYLHHNCP